MSLRAELDLAISLAREAASLVAGYWGKPLEVENKPGDEPVTVADHAANDLIVRGLRAALPDDALLSEELPDDGSRLGAERVWMVDPIDGTRDFIAGQQGFAVMIGLCVGGRPVMGVVCQPPTGLLWAGAVGETAFREDGAGVRTPLTVSSIAGPPGIRLVSSKSHRTDDIDRFRRELGINNEQSLGGVGLKMCLVADSSRDLYVYPGQRTKIWDTCAPEAILHAAGGRVTDIEGTPLVYTEANAHNRRGIVASNGPLHPRVLEVLARIRAEPSP